MATITGHTQRMANFDEIIALRNTVGPIPTTPVPVIPAKVWAVQDEAFGDEWLAGDGSSHSDGLVTPPDPDSWYMAENGITHMWPAGGSDGVHHYQPVVDSASQWWVDKFDTDETALLVRWELTGWSSANNTAPIGSYYNQRPELQHLTAGPTRIAVVAEVVNNLLLAVTSIELAVLDLTGAILAQWSRPTPILAFSQTDTLAGGGTCLDADCTAMFFAFDDVATASRWIVRVELATGEYTFLFTLDAVDLFIGSVDPTWFGLGSANGLIEIDGDFVISGSNGIARVSAAGAPRWWDNSQISGFDSYAGLAHSGTGSLWVSHSPFTIADNFTYDGVLLQSVTIPEPMLHAWVVGNSVPRGVATVKNEEQRMRWRQGVRT